MLRQLIVPSCISLSVTAWSAGAGNAPPVSSGLHVQQHAAWQSIGPAPPAITTPIVADAATHTIYIGEIVDLALDPAAPALLYADGTFVPGDALKRALESVGL